MRQIADSGQVFRFTEESPGRFLVRARDRKLVITDLCSCVTDGLSEYAEVPAQYLRDGQFTGTVRGYLLDCSREEYEEFWKSYFDMDGDYAGFIRSVHKDDIFLTRAADYASGIRILRQDPWEMLISFIISQRKSIPAIRSSIEKLCERFGTDGAFPEPEALAQATLAELRDCSVGYRDEYILDAAAGVVSGEIDLKAMEELSDGDLMKELLKIKGVGVKVANCVMLFGFHRIGAFPVDVWIKKVEDTCYGGHFPVEDYPGYAGVLQQYMFYAARVNGMDNLTEKPAEEN